MKPLLPALALFLTPALAFAQKKQDYTPIEKAPYPAVVRMPGFRHLADTTGKAATNIPAGSTVTVVGQASPRWAVIEHNFLTFYVPMQALGLRGIDVVTSEARINAPLPLDPDTGTITYTEVVQVPGVGKDDLYTRGKTWFVKTFNTPLSVIQADDKEAGLLIGKGWETVYIENLGILVPTRLWYTITLNFRDGRYKQEISGFRFQIEPSATYPNQPIYPAEETITGTQKGGKPTSWARNHRRALVVTTAANVQAIQTGMKPSSSTDW